MDARAYLEQIVVPTIQDYAASVTSVRHALLACLATFHTVDYLAAPGSPANMRKQLRDACPSFGRIDEIAHAFKHVESSRTGLRVEGVISRPPMIWDQCQFDLSRWDDAFGGVTLDENRDIDLLAELNTVLAYLRSLLPALEDRWVSDLQAWAASEPLVREVYLFGSRVKGSHVALSDLDIAILPAGETAGERDGNYICSAEKWRHTLSGLISVPVHLHVADPDTDKVVWPAVQDHGRRIFPVRSLPIT